jgi:hypothetical protein
MWFRVVRVRHPFSIPARLPGGDRRRLHMPQPRAACVAANLEACMGFARAQPPSVLSLRLVLGQKLNEQGGACFAVRHS